MRGVNEVDIKSTDINISPVQQHTQLLAALQARDLDSFLDLLQQSATDVASSCLVSACRKADCTQFVELLLRHGADPNTLNPILQKTPLHIAAEQGCYETLQVLLYDGRINVNALNGSDQTVLHVLVNKCADAKEDADRFRRCISLLLDWPNNVKEWMTEVADPQHPLDVNTSDWLGNIALHYAAQNKDQDTILTLLEHGSYIGSRNHAGDMPILDIEPETLEKFLNTRLKMPSDELLLFKYDFLVPPVELHSVLKKNGLLHDETDDMLIELSSLSPEMDPIVKISHSSKLQHLILHPILSSFIHLKWQRTRNFYYYSVAFYVVFVLLLTFLIVYHYITAHHHHQHDEHKPSCWLLLKASCFFEIIIVTLLVICCVCLILKFLFQLVISPVQYLCRWNTCSHFILTLLAVTILFRGWGAGENVLTAITLFFAWTQLLLLTGEHPAISVCFQLFRKISCTFLKYLAWYSLLIIAFSLSFYALFHDSETYIPEKNMYSRLFHNPLTSLFTVFSMFVGGFGTKFLPFELAAGISHIVFILFMFFLTLVLLNIFTGLAVSQIQNIESKAELIFLRAKVNAVSDIEMMLLGSPMYVHLRVRRLYLSHNAMMAWIVKSSVYMYMYCNLLQYFKNLHHRLLLFPDHASIQFPFGSSSKVILNYKLDYKVLVQAAKIVQRKDDEAKQQLESHEMFRTYEERLKNIEASLARSEALQQDVLQLLQSHSWKRQ